jgi:hypothetical protein
MHIKISMTHPKVSYSTPAIIPRKATEKSRVLGSWISRLSVNTVKLTMTQHAAHDPRL